MTKNQHDKPETKATLFYGGKPVRDVEELKEKMNEGLKKLQDEEYLHNLVEKVMIRKYFHRKCESLETQVIKGSSFSVLGPDGGEIMCSLMFCNKCQMYYLNCYNEPFMGGDGFTSEHELSIEETETVIEAVSKCKNPDDRRCRCLYHEKLEKIAVRDFLAFLKKEDPDFYYRVIPDGIKEVVKEVVSKCENPSDMHCSCIYHEELRKINKDFLIFLKVENPNLYYRIFPEEKERK